VYGMGRRRLGGGGRERTAKNCNLILK